jgi:hypothetical protein
VGSRRCSSTATTPGTGTPVVLVAQPVPVVASMPAWTGIHSAAWGSCTATPVVDTDIGTDTGISVYIGLDLAWVWIWSQEIWTPLLAAAAWTGTHNSMAWGSCTATWAAGMDMGTDTGISACMVALALEIWASPFLVA